MHSVSPKVRATRLDRILRPIHSWIWADVERRARKLLRFAETEADGGRDLSRAAELTPDPLLRRLYLAHASDEQRHAELFRRRGAGILRSFPPHSTAAFQANWFAPGERGLDDLRVDHTPDDALLAFLHLSEKAAASRFAVYREVLEHDPATRAVFDEVLDDEAFHMNYTYSQLTRVSPQRYRRRLWWSRFSRLWKGYLRLATAVASAIGTIVLTIQYFILLPPFAWLARRAERREPPGWTPISPKRNNSIQSQY
jgi:rubrerythrin